MENTSDTYQAILRDMESWPQYKIDFYNNCVAISAHAKKLVRKDGKLIACSVHILDKHTDIGGT